MAQAKQHKSYRVEVTQEDIDKARPNNSRHCAVALAIGRFKPDARSISVDISTIRYSSPRSRKRFIFITPARVQDYIAAFDAGDKIKPFSFAMPHEAYVHPMARVHPTPKSTKLVRIAARVKTQKKGGGGQRYVVEGRSPLPRSRRAPEYRHFGRRVLRENWQKKAHGVVMP